MILLLGGTAETAALAAALSDAGFEVLVSTVTDLPLDLALSEKVSRRSGFWTTRLWNCWHAIVEFEPLWNSTHPYAEVAHAQRDDGG